MKVEVLGRYGSLGSFESEAEIQEAIDRALAALGREEFAEPDFEHDQISIAGDDWSMFTKVSGLTGIGNFSDPSTERYMRDIPTAELREMYLTFGRGELDELLRLDWKAYEDLPPFDSEYYLFSSDPSCTSLHKAASKGDVEAVERLIDEGAVLEAKDSCGRTALHYAVQVPHLEVVELLLQRGADVNATTNDGATALHQVPWIENDELMLPLAEQLLDYGADIDAEDHEGNRPIHVAVWIPNNLLVNFLLERGSKKTGLMSRLGRAWMLYITVPYYRFRLWMSRPR